MTYYNIIDLFRQHTITWNILFNQFEYISPGEYSRDTNLLYPLVSFERAVFGAFDTNSTTYKISLAFSTRSIEGLQNQEIILSNLINSMQIYMIDFVNSYPALGITNITFLTDQEAGNDRTYVVRTEFDLMVMNESCQELLLELIPIDCSTTPPVCNVVLDNVQAFVVRNVLLTIQTTFTSIVGLDYFEIYLSNSLQPFTLVNVDNTPQLVNVFGLPFQGPDTYNVRIIWYDNCGNSQSQDFGPFILP
jgi:hypothetical protein